jgi:diphthamide biosynthesis methyltransferase
MVGDVEKLYNKGDKVTMFVLGKPYHVTVIASDVTDYERKYLVAFSDNPGDTKWVTNQTIRQFSFLN